MWADAEALIWWVKKQPLPADLVTTGFSTDTRPGAVGQPNTLVLFGPGEVGYGAFAGVRVSGGGWLDSHEVIGLEASGFLLEDRGQAFGANSTSGGIPLLALRYRDAVGNAENAFVIAAPSVPGAAVGPFTGGISVRTDSQLWGADGSLLHAFCWTRNFQLVGLVGFRYLDLDENVAVLTRKGAVGGSSVPFQGNSYAAPAFELTDDRFHGRNQFFGAQLGLRGDYFCNHFFVEVAGKVALGRTDEVANVLGVSTLQPKDAPRQTAAGGLFVLPSNAGRLLNQDFGVVPEVQIKGGVLLTPWCRATLGYNFLYWNRVLRPGSQVDLNIDPRQVPTDPSFKAGNGASFPRADAHPSDFWAQGLTVGLEFTF